MKWFTHIGFSALIFLIIRRFAEFGSRKILLFSLLACIVGGILPDIELDLKILNHRGLLHSITGLVFLSAGLYLITKSLNLKIIGFCFIIGYLSHLFLDSFTPTGVRLLPGLKKYKGTIKTGGLQEKLVSIIIWVFLIFFTLF